ncbi:DUF1501 domain-containing protein [Lignipirellula cremea]|uniref:DUF1501 domain-containing protein n=1 Tax=Lignipirellula cremea TaxID=2528010 RepID=A0A518E4Q2_9BACT|nr:DUF1501 domain-containing protein [Lignipirellula cremea]QDU99075.1 hypothetical protein Pla8534_69860 [Lignipirellula cremea]
MLTGYGRRFFLGSMAAALAGASGRSWLRTLAAEEAGQAAGVKQIILLWLNGGPATIDLWDLKPGHRHGGPFQEISTQTPGVRISEHLPQLARWTNEMAIVRSMTSKEGDHGRAVHLTRTGYSPQAGIDFPDLGALVVNEFPQPERLLPGFVSITPPRRMGYSGNGFLGPQCAPMQVGEQAKAVGDLVVDDLQPGPSLRPGQTERFDLLRQFDQAFVQSHPQSTARQYQASVQRAMRTMDPRAVAAFDLEAEADPVRTRYGKNLFGQGCLLARRLVEHGVSFVEVTLDGWDTHNENFQRVASLSEQLDHAFAALLADLQERQMLSSTLVLCQGEFGRTPRINGNAGRDHWPKVWSAVLAGGGVGRGQVIGQTNAGGTEIESEAHAVPDLVATVCQAAGIDPTRQNMSNVDRPIRIAPPEHQLIRELL